MKPLIVLLAAFGIDLLFLYSRNDLINPGEAGRVGLCCMLVFTATGHFKFTRGMSQMMPDKVPFRIFLVYASGIYEALAGIALLIEPLRELAAWSLIIFFVISLPMNIYAACKNLNYETGAYDGNGIRYLWFRIPLQLMFIVWTWWCGIWA